MSQAILVVAAHPDDETYGAGGTIARHVAEGDQVTVLFVTDGVTARHDQTDQQRAAGVAACAALGVDDVRFADLPDQRLDGMPLLEVIGPIYALVKELRPTIVYTHHKGDANQDHRRLFEATLVAVRPFGENPVDELRCFEVASSTEWGPASMADWAFLPSLFVDIGDYVDIKAKAIEAYRHTHVSEVPAFPHPRAPESVLAYDTARGVSVGLQAAEAFVSVRRLIR
ncbi:MAG: PIG-L deacetylase family protein [Actinomycetota bacterium]